MKRLFKPLALVLSLFLLLSALPLPGLAVTVDLSDQQEKEERTLVISSEDQFLQFAENCRLDAFSQNLTVNLTQDLDLSGNEFKGIPLFLGTFQGNHHKITGVNLNCDGSNLGLFRFLGKGSSVNELTVSGTFAPQGSSLNIGGIAGSNAGSITNCRFEGNLTGVDRIGGIAGINELTGIIENCQVSGSVVGDHFLGGVTGDNKGVIRNCVSRADINTIPRENTMNVKSISMETITGTESPNTVTDIGGIAGSSVGVIRDSINRGNVGYPHMGYNAGGIAGSHSGYIVSCQNFGEICGRKEVGGIVGQFEPVSRIEFKLDTLQILEEQLTGASSLLNRASYNAQNNLGAVGAGISNMLKSSEDARKAIEELTPESILDPDTIIAAKNTVKTSLQSMYQSMSNIGAAAGATAGQLSQDLKAVSAQMSAMGKTIKEANENLGVRLNDVSDQDTEDELSGKISHCQNYGPISGDINAGGIAGSIAYESDLDPEEDLMLSGDQSLNFDGNLRAVILNCENQGTISGKKIHTGGIAGWMTMGLVKNCINTGTIDAEKVQYAGGIAGSSQGYIRSCSVKCRLIADSCAGGIAGSGTIVTDCLSMVDIQKAKEKLGAVLGIREPPRNEDEKEPLKNNLYMTLRQDIGAIDGISYRGLAEPVAPYKFRELPNLPETFQQVKLIFENEEDSKKIPLILPIGSILRPEDVPQVAEKEGHTGVWQDLDLVVGKRVYFDTVFKPLYTPFRMTISSVQTRSSQRPVLLAEGSFSEISEIEMDALALPVIPDETVLEAWSLPQFSAEEATVLHFLQPDNTDIASLCIFVRTEDGTWKLRDSTVNASHLVFSAEPGEDAFCVAARKDNQKAIYLLCAAAAALVILILCRLRFSRKKGVKHH